ncbi:NAD(P)/FAD-dependent oxidoreductase [Nafulsella turpanensis]|uniref:NAD(P)/FAD-dependent oxidoreductase n=1 Tax=Nafulsella turpanensis TaxID=1265690 RepID=UPI000345E867|nr:FAD-dependent oxidoreductase [Nafulsella turpanensis]
MLSFWEKNTFLQYDYIVVGGGIVGLSTAIAVKEKQPAAQVLVLERGLFPSGASTKNAGFACFGSLTELLVDIEQMGEEAALALVKMRWQGLQLLRERLGDENFGFLQQGGYELIREAEEPALEKMGEVNALLEPLFQQTVFREAPEKIKEFGFKQEQIRNVVYNPLEGQVDTGLMMRQLIALAQEKGIRLLTGVQVQKLEEEEQRVVVQVQNPVSAEPVFFSAPKVAICTNAFSRQFLPDIALEPGRGQVLVTEPIEKLKFKGVFHYDEGYYYFRNYGKRVIFGGGRNLDFERENTTELNLNQRIQEALEQQLREIILPDQPFTIAHRWSGIMAFGPDKQPVLRKIGERMVAGIRLGGMGVAIGSGMGAAVARLLTGEKAA